MKFQRPPPSVNAELPRQSISCPPINTQYVLGELNRAAVSFVVPSRPHIAGGELAPPPEDMGVKDLVPLGHFFRAEGFRMKIQSSKDFFVNRFYNFLEFLLVTCKFI
jgi:hypothetical protein